LPPKVIGFLFLIPVGIFNNYLFSDANLPLLAFCFILSSLVLSRGRIPRKLFGKLSIILLSFLIYSFLLIDKRFLLNQKNIFLALNSQETIDLLFYFSCFFSASIIYTQSKRFSKSLWYFIVYYIFAFIIRNSFDIKDLQDGANLSSGITIFSLIPFVFLCPDQKTPIWFPNLAAILCALWLALIGARTATFAVLFFILAFWLWPFISKSKRRYLAFFISILGTVVLFYILYLNVISYTNTSIFENNKIGILQKDLGTRVDIWKHLIYIIKDSPWFGHGASQSTSTVEPLSFLEFSFNRGNLGSHSLYFELLYRLGLVGLLLFLFFVTILWCYFWKGKAERIVQVAAIYLAALLLFATTCQVFIFNSVLKINSAFMWIIFGLATGATINKKMRRQ